MSEAQISASIITIGDELLIGQVIDTNSAWMAKQLNTCGISVKRRVAVGDIWEDIWESLEEESRHSRIILITGGLGPTADDITKPLLCSYFGSRLIINNDVLQHVEHLFKNVFGRPITERNRKQAEVPDGCTVIHNALGTAPGMWFEKDGCIYVSMPGVPHEMKGMMSDLVLPRIRERFISGHILHRTLLTAGIGESFLADHIEEWEKALPAAIKLAYLPSYGMVRLRITGRGNDEQALKTSLDVQFEILKKRVSQWLVADEDLTMPQITSALLKERKKTLSTAESCTGGYIAHLLTREPGASAIYPGSILTYSNELKEKLLKVEHETLMAHGAVSEETVRQMAKGALEATGSDLVIAVSGILGPDGGSDGKPVGTVWMAAGDKDILVTQLFNFRFDRLRNLELTAINALNLLRKFVIDQEY